MSYNKIPPRWLHCPRRGQPVAGERPARPGLVRSGPVLPCPGAAVWRQRGRPAALPCPPVLVPHPLLLFLLSAAGRAGGPCGAAAAPRPPAWPGLFVPGPRLSWCGGAGRLFPAELRGPVFVPELSRGTGSLLPTGALMLGSRFALVKFTT